MSQNTLREGGYYGTENHLVLEVPVTEIQILDDLDVSIGFNSERLRWSRSGSIKIAIEMLPLEIWNNLSFPKEVVVTGEFDGDEMMDGSKGSGRRRSGSVDN